MEKKVKEQILLSMKMCYVEEKNLCKHQLFIVAYTNVDYVILRVVRTSIQLTHNLFIKVYNSR